MGFLQLLPFFSKKNPKMPVLLQLSQAECGAACLAMILGYFGRKTRVSECRNYCGGGRDGVSAETIVDAARRFGLQVKAYSLSTDQLQHISLPAVIHWKFNHFIVLVKWSGEKIVVVDPAVGKYAVSRKVFNDSFTGVALTFKRGSDFREKSREAASTWNFYIKNLLQDRAVAVKILLQVLAASLVLQGLGLMLPVFTKIMVDHVLVMQTHDLLRILGLGLLVLVLMYLVIHYLRGAMLVYLQGRIDSRMMTGFLRHVMSLPYRFFQQRRSGDLLMRLSSNITIREIITNQTLSMILDGFFVLGYLVIILVKAPLLAAVVLLLGGIQAVILFGTKQKIHQLMQSNLVASAETQSYLIEILRGIAMVKASGSEGQAMRTWSGKFFKELNVSLKRHHLLALIDTAVGAVQLASPLMLLWLGGFMVLNGTLSLGSMLALQALGIAFLTPLSSMIETGQQWQLAGAYLERVKDIVEAQPEQVAGHSRRKHRIEGALAVKDLAFRYDRHSSPVLRDISFRVASRQKLALVGRTGAGKTTLALLLIGLYRPTAGYIHYDGVSLEDIDLHHLRKQFGAVLQESFIFHGSIRQNIAFTQPDLPFDMIVEAAKIAAIHDEIEKMPMGYETLISEGGIGLSGGQRQRLSIARAIVHKPAILLLDEATSHLDAVTEKIVDGNLARYLGTRIVIAHRLSTIQNADVILVLKDGRIIEQGRHNELLSKDGFYTELVSSQAVTLSTRQ
jgi:ABC-type bacteriocin/lantibiotic exporter with double-glycine peptidase domain